MSQFGRKFIVFFGLAAAGMSTSHAHATMTTLKQVQVSNGSQIDLLFDGKVGKSQARTEFFNDVIQISLNDVSVYPAKISSVNGGPLVKIFAYQYAPKLVRCRLTVNGKAEDYKDKLQIVTNGKVLSLRLAGAAVKTDQVAIQAAHPVQASVKEAAEKAPEKSPEKSKVAQKQDDQPREIEAVRADAGQAALLDRVMKSTPSKSVPVTVVDQKEGRESSSQSERPRKNSLAGGKPLPSPMGVMAKLLGVIGLFGAMAFAAKKFFNGKGMGGNRSLNARIAKSAGGETGWMSALGGFARSAAAGIGRKDKMIEVLSNHYLGPKKSIAVVRIMGRTLVLGVTNESINLISQINGSSAGADAMESEEELNLDLEALLANGAVNAAMNSVKNNSPAAQSKQVRVSAQTPVNPSRPLPGTVPGMDMSGAGPSSFSAVMHQEVKKPATPGVRNQIRSRLEGLKQL